MSENSIKAFELSSVKEKITIGERVRIKIECIEFRGKSLYLGTTDSFVIELQYPSGRALQSKERLQYKYLGLKKPVVILKAICILERIVCICDSNLIILNQNDLEVISYGIKLKNISALTFNENPNNSNPFSVELCIARRKQLIVYNMTNEKFIPIKEVSLQQFVLSLSMDGQYICVGTDSQFLIVDWETSFVQELCSVDSEIAVPVSKRITKEEFLISGPSSLGLFVKSTGISERPPLQWTSDILSIAYSHPYILCLSEHFVSIFSVVDQQLKQQIPFNGGTYLDNFDGNVLISNGDSVFQLKSIAWEKQLETLLSLKKVKEALDLSHNWREAGLSQLNYNQILMKVKRKAAFIELSLKHFEEAKQLLIESDSDVWPLIQFYTNLLPESLIPEDAINQSSDDILISIDKNSEDFEEYKNFLLEFLEDLFSSKCEQYKNREIHINCALICLYLENSSDQLLNMLSETDIKLDSKWLLDRLQQTHSYQALAIYYSCNESTFEEAIEIWIKLETGIYSDPYYPGLQCLANFLCRIESEQIIFKYIDFVLERDQTLGVHILINRNLSPNLSNAERMIKQLHKYPKAEQLYQEHLVFKLRIKSEKFATDLALKYIDQLMKQISSDDIQCEDIKDLRLKLRLLLRESNCYKTKLILEKTIEAKLHYESTILYAKLGEHQKALIIFVEELRDYQMAQQYCLNCKDPNIFSKLLSIYLSLSLRNSESPNKSCDDWVTPAIQLLNSEVTQFNAIQVLQLIPQKWCLSTIQQFLSKAIRQSMHRKRLTFITKGLAEMQNKRVKHQKLITQRQLLLMNEHSICSVCGNPINEPEFMWFPNLQIVLHPHCGKGLAITSTKSQNGIQN